MIFQKVQETIASHNLIKSDEHIVLGLSGGPDSVCLFHILLRLRQSLGIHLHPVHVNHGLRPGAAERDQNYVEELCREHGISCKVITADCRGLAGAWHMTSEEAGRKLRYDAFYDEARQIAEKLAAEHGESPDVFSEHIRIAVAHNADDQAETILFRVLRGTGTDGLAGIAYERKERGFSVIRPILDIPRKEIEEYCREHDLRPVEDHTNHQSIYTRNKIRLELLPELEKEYNENVRGALLRLGRIAASDSDYLQQCAEEALQEFLRETSSDEIVLERDGLAGLHEALRHRILLQSFARLGLASDISAERIAAADSIIEKKQAPKTVEFPRGYRVTVAGGLVHICAPKKRAK